MRNPGGYAITTEQGKEDIEEDTITCFHCNRIVFVNPKMDPSKQEFDRVVEAERCRMCMRHICPICVGQMKCDPFEKKMERLEARDRLLRSIING